MRVGITLLTGKFVQKSKKSATLILLVISYWMIVEQNLTVFQYFYEKTRVRNCDTATRQSRMGKATRHCGLGQEVADSNAAKTQLVWSD